MSLQFLLSRLQPTEQIIESLIDSKQVFNKDENLAIYEAIIYFLKTSQSETSVKFS